MFLPQAVGQSATEEGGRGRGNGNLGGFDNIPGVKVAELGVTALFRCTFEPVEEGRFTMFLRVHLCWLTHVASA